MKTNTFYKMEENNNLPSKDEKHNQSAENNVGQQSETNVPQEHSSYAGTSEYSSTFSGARIDLSLINSKITEARKEISNYLIGQHEMVDLLLIGLFSGGHILLEGVPSIAKTLTAKVLSKTLSVDFP